jgi:hypothetical protein
MLGHLLISQVKNSGLNDDSLWVFQNRGREFVRRADDDTNVVIPAQQLFHNAPPGHAGGANY